jgi:glycosyltransferase involved in cell wall biosynthesis
MVIAGAVFKANKKLDLPLVLDLHENRPEIMKLYPHLQRFPGKQIISINKWKQKEEGFIKSVNKTIVVTREAKNEIENRIDLEDDKIKIVPNSVTRSFYSDIIINDQIINRYKDKFVILYLGDTGIRRGLLTAIDAVDALKSSISNLKMVIVGSNTSDSILTNRVKTKGLEKYIDFEGWQGVDLFPSYIIASAIGISPLYRNIHHDTTYANKIFQYMSFSKPVLVSDATAQRNLIIRTESGLVHKEKDVEDFTNKVLDLYNNPELRNALGENGKSFIENEFYWEKVSQSLLDIYDELGTNR